MEKILANGEKGNKNLKVTNFTFCRPGNVLLSHALRQSTIGAGALNVRVRNGIVCYLSAKTTRSTKREINTNQYFMNYSILVLSLIHI